MSRGASITLGVASLLIAVGFMAVPPTPGMSMSGLRLAGAFCALIALACLVPRSRPVTARLIAAVVLGLCVWYVYSMWNGPMTSGRRTQPSLVNAIAAFTFFGLPAAYVLLRGFVPRWHGAASITPESDDANAVGDLWRSRIGSGPVTIEGFALTSDEADAFAREFTARHRTTLSRWHRLAITIGALIIVGL